MADEEFDDGTFRCPCSGSLCDGDRTNNSWVEGDVCLLDSMTREQVIYTIEHNPQARRDLQRVTTNEELLTLLDQVPLLPTGEPMDIEQRYLNSSDCLPFYNQMGGRTSDQ